MNYRKPSYLTLLVLLVGIITFFTADKVNAHKVLKNGKMIMKLKWKKNFQWYINMVYSEDVFNITNKVIDHNFINRIVWNLLLTPCWIIQCWN